jgi:hypothetical protein
MANPIETYSQAEPANRRLVINPLFYDAMSGEFIYDQEPEKRRHTLGRLAYATFAKGEITTMTPAHKSAEYNPSWAQHVTVGVDFTPRVGFDPNDDVNLALGVLLRSNTTGNGLYVDEHNDVLHIGSATDNYYSLELGKNLTIARQAVAETVQDFFNASH